MPDELSSVIVQWSELVIEFRCPKDLGDLKELRCQVCGHQYYTIADQPILIDFKRSIVEEADFKLRNGGGFITNREGKPALKQFLWGRSEAPGPAADWISQQIPGGLVLIIGGGVQGAGFHRLTDVQTVAFDIFPTENTQFVADAHQVPLPNESVDAVWIQAVLEHVLDPERVVTEIVRVLKPGGIVYADTPFMQPVHEGAYDFTRFSHSGHRWLFRQFDEVGSGVSVGPGRAAVLAIRHAFTALFRSQKAGSLIALSLFWLRFIDNVTPDRTQRDAAGGVWFLGRKSDRCLNPQDMVKYYQA